MLPDVGIWCNILVCRNHTQQILHHMTSPLVSVLFVPSIHSYHFCRKFLIFFYVGMAQGVSLSLYIGIGAKFENTQKTGERRLRTAEYRTVLLETDLKGKRTYPAEK